MRKRELLTCNLLTCDLPFSYGQYGAIAPSRLRLQQGRVVHERMTERAADGKGRCKCTRADQPFGPFGGQDSSVKPAACNRGGCTRPVRSDKGQLPHVKHRPQGSEQGKKGRTYNLIQVLVRHAAGCACVWCGGGSCSNGRCWRPACVGARRGGARHGWLAGHGGWKGGFLEGQCGHDAVTETLKLYSRARTISEAANENAYAPFTRKSRGRPAVSAPAGEELWSRGVLSDVVPFGLG